MKNDLSVKGEKIYHRDYICFELKRSDRIVVEIEKQTKFDDSFYAKKN